MFLCFSFLLPLPTPESVGQNVQMVKNRDERQRLAAAKNIRGLFTNIQYRGS